MTAHNISPKELNPYYPKALLQTIANLQPKLRNFISEISKSIQAWRNLSSDTQSASPTASVLTGTNPMMIVSDVMLLLFFISFVIADFSTVAVALSAAMETGLIYKYFPWTQSAYPFAVLICIFGTGVVGLYIYTQSRGVNPWMHFGKGEERRQIRIQALIITLMSIATGLLVGYSRLCGNNPELCVVILDTSEKVVSEILIVATALLAAGTIFSYALSGFVHLLILSAWVTYFLFVLARHLLDYGLRLLIASADIIFHFALSPLFLLGILLNNFGAWVKKAGD